jgi:predicted RNA-binding Zn ribbon-like protein
MRYAEGHPVRLLGGRLALDFVNTADWTTAGKIVHEKLGALDDLAIWAAEAGLKTLALPDSLNEAIRLRAGLRRDFLRLMNSAAAGKFRPVVRRPSSRAPLLAAVEASAAALLVDRGDAVRLKCCPSEHCGWLFVDETGNARRLWCSMAACGNRAKARRHYLRATARD